MIFDAFGLPAECVSVQSVAVADEIIHVVAGMRYVASSGGSVDVLGHSSGTDGNHNHQKKCR